MKKLSRVSPMILRERMRAAVIEMENAMGATEPTNKASAEELYALSARLQAASSAFREAAVHLYQQEVLGNVRPS